MPSLSRLVQIGYILGLSLVLSLLLGPTWVKAQFGAPPFGVSTGYRSTPGWPTIAVPIISGSSSVSGAGSAGGITGGVAGSASSSFSTQIIYINPGTFLPNNGQIIGPPMPTITPMLNNLLSDTTGAPWALMGAMSMGGGGGIGMITPMGGGMGMGGMGMGGMGMGGMGMMGMGGMGGFAGKGMGGFNGKKGL
jgi:hypothetical protein